jgi:4-amino-4-deoxy-L-arabinose transferase-like glycosyltransferase
MKFSFPKAFPYFALGFFLLIGALLRILPLEARDFWYDEAFTGILIRMPFPEMMTSIIHDVHPPVYYWVLKIWSMIFGSGIVALRMFSVTCGVGTIAAAFFTLKSWYKASAAPAMIAALILAIDPFFVNYSQEARMYAFFGLLIIGSTSLLIHAWKVKTQRARILFGLSLLMLCLTHYLGAIFSLGFVIADLLHARKEGIKTFLPAYVLPFIGGVIWLPFFYTQIKSHSSLNWVPNAPFSSIATSLHIFLFGAPVGVSGVPPALGYRLAWLTVPDVTLVLVISLTALVGYLFAAKKWDLSLKLLGFMTAFPLLMTWFIQIVGQKLYVERFLTGAAVFLVLFLAAAVSKMKKPYVIAVISVYILFVALIKPWSYTTPLSDLHKTITEKSGTETLIFANPFDYILGRYYQGEGRKIRLYQEDNPTEVINSWVLVQPENQIMSLPTTPHVFISHHPEKYPNYTSLGGNEDTAILQSM